MSVAIQVSTTLLRCIRPEIASVGDGIVDWHTPPVEGWPAGRYEVVKIREGTVWMRPAPSPERGEG